MSFISGIPHVWCLRGDAALIWNSALSDVLISSVYFFIPFAIQVLQRYKALTLDPQTEFLFAAFKGFIFFCGMGHLINAANIWLGWYWLKIACDYVTFAASAYAGYIIVVHGKQYTERKATNAAIYEKLRDLHEMLNARHSA